MPRSQKPRHQQRHRVPDDFSRRRMEIVKPEHATERTARKYISIGKLMVRCCIDKEVQGRIASALRSGQSVTKKLECLQAVVLEKTVKEFHSPKYMNALGMRMVDCQCGPGVGHNAPPKRPQRPRL